MYAGYRNMVRSIEYGYTYIYVYMERLFLHNIRWTDRLRINDFE